MTGLFEGGTWKGQGTYYNGQQSPFDMTLVVTVSGITFTGTLKEAVYSSVVAVRGTVVGTSSGDGVKITFTDYATVSGGQIALNVTYSATVSNGHMDGVWSYAGDTSPDGTLTLSRVIG